MQIIFVIQFPKSDPINFTNFSCFLGSMGPKLEPLWPNFDHQWFNRNTAPRTKYFVLEMPFRPLDEQAHRDSLIGTPLVSLEKYRDNSVFGGKNRGQAINKD